MSLFKRSIEVVPFDEVYKGVYKRDLDLIVGKYRSRDELEARVLDYNVLWNAGNGHGPSREVYMELGRRNDGFFYMVSWEDQVNSRQPEDRPNIPVIEEVLREHGIEKYFQHYIKIDGNRIIDGESPCKGRIQVYHEVPIAEIRPLKIWGLF